MKTFKFLSILILAITVTSCSTNDIENDEQLFNALNDAESNVSTVCNPQNTNEIETAVFNAINAHRKSIGKSSLCFEETIVYVESQIHSDYMAERGVSSHDGFQERAKRILNELKGKGIAENVAIGVNQNIDNFNVDGLVQSWLDSEPHRKSIEGDFTHTAVSFSVAENGDVFFTQLFVKL